MASVNEAANAIRRVRFIEQKLAEETANRDRLLIESAEHVDQIAKIVGPTFRVDLLLAGALRRAFALGRATRH